MPAETKAAPLASRLTAPLGGAGCPGTARERTMALNRMFATMALGALAVGCTMTAPELTLAAQPLPDAKIAHADYANPSLWLCRPGVPGDKCKINLDATVIAPDGT